MDAMRKIHDEQDAVFAMIKPNLMELISGENTSGENCLPDDERPMWQNVGLDAKLD